MADEFEVDYQRLLISMSLLKQVEDSDYTQQHSLRVGRLVKKMATKLGYDIKKINLITRSAYFHDIGKIKLSKNVIFKVGALTDKEYDEMKLHPEYSEDILLSLGLYEEAKIARSHHERLNGSGYPNGLKGEEIGDEVRLLAVADVFDAITSDRPYRRSLSIPEAVLFLYSKTDDEVDLKMVKILHEVLIDEKKISNKLS